VNALSKDTPLFAEIDGKYGVFTLKELYELHNQGHKIRAPVLLNEHGSIGWVEVEDVVNFGKQKLKRITLATSRLFVEATEDTIIPAYSSNLFSGREKQIKIKFKHVNELKVAQDPRNNDTLLLATRIPLKILEGNQNEWDFGFALGFFLAEGSIVKRKHSFTKNSLARLKALARKKGMALQKYLEFMTDIKLVFLTIGQSDFERRHIQILQKHFKFATPYKKRDSNAYVLYSSDLSLIHLIKNYIDGSTSHDKHVKNEVYNNSRKFLEGILDGFLAGDGCYVKKGDYFSVRITANYLLYNDLIFISKGLGYDVHLWKAIYQNGGFANGKFYLSLLLSIVKTYHRHTAFGLLKERIKSIENIGEKEAYNLVLKQLYPETDKRAIFNHLYFIAFGFLVSDAVKTLERGALGSSLPAPVLG